MLSKISPIDISRPASPPRYSPSFEDKNPIQLAFKLLSHGNVVVSLGHGRFTALSYKDSSAIDFTRTRVSFLNFNTSEPGIVLAFTSQVVALSQRNAKEVQGVALRQIQSNTLPHTETVIVQQIPGPKPIIMSDNTVALVFSFLPNS